MDRLVDFIANIRLWLKWLKRATTLAYFRHGEIFGIKVRAY
jgi:hypothetical protein